MNSDKNLSSCLNVSVPSHVSQSAHEVTVGWTRVALYVAISPGKGRGVFASGFIPRGTVIERAPYDLLSDKAITIIRDIKASHLHWYMDDEERNMFQVYGYAMLYNHSSTPNIEVDIDLQKQSFIFTTLRDIQPNEELMFDYDYDFLFTPVASA